jgi:hypothetical protein
MQLCKHQAVLTRAVSTDCASLDLAASTSALSASTDFLRVSSSASASLSAFAAANCQRQPDAKSQLGLTAATLSEGTTHTPFPVPVPSAVRAGRSTCQPPLCWVLTSRPQVLTAYVFMLASSASILATCCRSACPHPIITGGPAFRNPKSHHIPNYHAAQPHYPQRAPAERPADTRQHDPYPSEPPELPVRALFTSACFLRDSSSCCSRRASCSASARPFLASS